MGKKVFLTKLFFWFVGECFSYGLSQGVAENVSSNNWVYYPVWITMFSGVSVGLTALFFWKEIKDLISE